MKIIHISPVFLPYKSGISNVVHEQTRRLASLGHQVSLLTPLYDSSLPKQEIYDNVKIIRLKPWLKYGRTALVPELLQLLKLSAAGRAMVHLHLPFFGAQELLWLSRNKSIKNKLTIQYHHDPQLAWPLKIFSWPGLWAMKSLIQKGDQVLVSSLDYIKNSLLGDLINPKFKELPLGVDVDRFTPAQPGNFSSQNAQQMLFVAALDRAHHFKGLGVLLQALHKIIKPQNKKTMSCRLCVVGQGNLLNYYKNLARQLKLDKFVNFSGPVSDFDLPHIYQSSDLLIFPSTGRAEAFGLVALEAMSSGLPVIASNLPGVRTLFADQKLLVRAGAVDELAYKISWLMQHPELSNKLGQNNRNRALTVYDWDKIVRQLEGFYHALN